MLFGANLFLWGEFVSTLAKNFIFAAAAVLVAAGVSSLVILQNNKADENIPTFSVEEYTPFIQRFAKEQPVARLKKRSGC